MALSLVRPLCFFDLETTGTQITKDRIVQIAFVKLFPNGQRESKSCLINPGISIPPNIAEIHGITDEKVQDAPKLEEVAQELIAFVGDSDFAGYNSNKFDIPFMVEEFYRVGYPFPMDGRNFVDVQNIFHKMEQRTLSAAYQFYCGQTMENAHDALYDTEVTLDVFLAQLNRYEQLSRDIPALAAFSSNSPMGAVDFAGRLAKNERGAIMYNFGKHKGRTVEEVMKLEPGYYGWMLDADFPFQTKDCLRAEVARLKALKEEDKAAGLQDKLQQLSTKFKKP